MPSLLLSQRCEPVVSSNNLVNPWHKRHDLMRCGCMKCTTDLIAEPRYTYSTEAFGPVFLMHSSP
jgi:hypothetical protein